MRKQTLEETLSYSCHIDRLDYSCERETYGKL